MRLPTFYKLFLIPNWGIIKYKCVEEFHFYVIFPAKKFVLSMIIRTFAAREPAKPLNDAQMCGSFLFLWVYGNKDSVYKNIFRLTRQTRGRDSANQKKSYTFAP